VSQKDPVGAPARTDTTQASLIAAQIKRQNVQESRRQKERDGLNFLGHIEGLFPGAYEAQTKLKHPKIPKISRNTGGETFT
jgi:hypothetical protein